MRRWLLVLFMVGMAFGSFPVDDLAYIPNTGISIRIWRAVFVHPPVVITALPPLPVEGKAPYGAVSFTARLHPGERCLIARIDYPYISPFAKFYKLVNGVYIPLEVERRSEEHFIIFEVCDNSYFDLNRESRIITDPVVLVVEGPVYYVSGGCSIGSVKSINIVWWFLPFLIIFIKRIKK